MGRTATDPSPALWAPPRGPRDPRTGWAWAWAARPASSFTEEPEADVVGAWRELVEVLAGERYARGWGLRRLATEAGVSFSVVADIEAGSTWPRLGTVEAISSALGFTPEVEDEPGHPVVEGVMRQVRRQRRTDGVSPRELAQFAGMRPNTLYELPRTVAGGSVRTLLVLIHQLDTRLVLVPTRPAQGQCEDR